MGVDGSDLRMGVDGSEFLGSLRMGVDGSEFHEAEISWSAVSRTYAYAS